MAAELASGSATMVRTEPARIQADTSLISSPPCAPKAARTSETIKWAPLPLVEGTGPAFSPWAIRTLVLSSAAKQTGAPP